MWLSHHQKDAIYYRPFETQDCHSIDLKQGEMMDQPCYFDRDENTDQVSRPTRTLSWWSPIFTLDREAAIEVDWRPFYARVHIKDDRCGSFDDPFPTDPFPSLRRPTNSGQWSRLPISNPLFERLFSWLLRRSTSRGGWKGGSRFVSSRRHLRLAFNQRRVSHHNVRLRRFESRRSRFLRFIRILTS